MKMKYTLKNQTIIKVISMTEDKSIKRLEKTFSDVLNISKQNHTISTQITLIIIIGLFLYEV